MSETLEETYRAGSPKSRELFERGREFMAGPAKGAYFYAPYPLTMARGEGCYLYDVDGRRFVDFTNHHSTQVAGHNHPAVVAAVREQLERGIALGAPVGVEAPLCEELCRRLPAVDRIRFCNSGTEATLHAIRLARGASGRPRIAKFEGGYHGSHDAVEISVAPPLDKAGPDDAPHSVPTAGGMGPHAAEDVLVLPYHNEEAVERLVRQHRDELACVMFDPKAGIMPLRPEFARAVRRITREHDVLLVFDEIVGFRVSRGGLQEHYGIEPDLSAFGKVVGGGFPAGAFGGRAEIMDLFDNTHGPTGFFQSGSFSAHPMTMVAGLATLQQLTPEAFVHLNGLGQRLRDGLNRVFAEADIAAQAVGVGSLFSIHFTAEEIVNYRSMARADKTPVHPVFLALLEEGYFLGHNLMMCSLSLPMDESHVDGLVGAMARTLQRI